MNGVLKTITYLSLIIFTLTSCVDGNLGKITENDKLTEVEYQALLRTARSFIAVSNLKISERDRKFVQTCNPSFRIHYTGYKSGRFSMTWSISERLSVMLSGDGPFLKESCRMKVSVIRF